MCRKLERDSDVLNLLGEKGEIPCEDFCIGANF